jgi:hypothetical protein
MDRTRPFDGFDLLNIPAFRRSNIDGAVGVADVIVLLRRSGGIGGGGRIDSGRRIDTLHGSLPNLRTVLQSNC